MASPLLTAAVPSIVNGISTLATNFSNQSNYASAQAAANAFARQERQLAQQYNSLENQFAQMARVGMNPNLLSGGDFMSTQPVGNQSVSPPTNLAPQMPADSLTQAQLGNSQSSNLDALTETENQMRSGKLTIQDATTVELWTRSDYQRASAHLTDKQREQLIWTTQQIKSDIARLNASTSLIKSQTAGQNLQNLYEGTFGYHRRQAEVMQILQSIATSRDQAAAYRAQTSQYMALAGYYGALTTGQQQSNEFQRATSGSAKASMEYEATGKRLQNNETIATMPYKIKIYQYDSEGRKWNVNILRNQDRIINVDANLAEGNEGWRNVQTKAEVISSVLDAGIKLNYYIANPASDQAIDRGFDRASKVSGYFGGNPSVQSYSSAPNPFSGGNFGTSSFTW